MQAILITAYKNIDHLCGLVRFFKDDDFSIYIHFDKKSNIKEKDKRRILQEKKECFFSQEYTINWGGLNHLKAILLLCKEAYQNPNNTFFHSLTGHDYPIQPILFFRQLMEDNFMEYHLLPYEPWPNGGLDRLEQYNLYDLFDGRSGWKKKIIKGLIKLQRKIGVKRKFAPDFPPLFGGSTYWSLKRECITYVFDYINQHPRFFDRFKYSFCSEEIFFQTILLNSPLKDTIINNNRRFIIWEERNENFPANLDMSDYKNIIKSEAFFARKFEYPISEELFQKVKQHILD